jgi:hypothetical protein
LEIGKVEIPQTQQPKLNTIPGKMEPLGNGQNARSFPNTTFNSTLADNELKSRLATETQPSGRGAYDPITIKGVDEEAQRLINENPDVARNFVLNEKEPSALHTATGVRLIKHYQDTGDYDRAVDVSMSLAEKLTKQGQAISAARLMSALNPDGVLVFASRQIQKINNVPKLKINKFGIGKDVTLEPETAQNLKKLAEIMQNAPDDATRIEASQNLQEALNALKPSGIGQKLSTTQTIAQLYNLKTNDRNVLSNEMFYALERANKYVAAPIDWAKSKLTGSERTVTFRTGGGNLWQNFLQGYKDYGNALVKGAKAGWRGVNPEGVTTQYELGHGLTFNKDGNIAERTASFFERSLGAALKGFDYAAFTRAKNQTIGEMAVLRSLNETGKVDKALVQKYMQNADENILNIADHYGKYITFQDDNLISRGLSVVKRGLNLGQDFGLGDFVLKYPRTPGALISRGLDYSPAGFLRSAYLMSSPILKGKAADSREVTLALSRAITGTLGVTGMGYFLADKGVITGSADKDKDIRNLQQQTGEGAYRVNVSALVRLVKSGFNPDSATKQAGDTMISYDWMQPIAMAISSGANINKSVKEKLNSKEVVSGAMAAAAGSVEGAINTIAEQPVLKGIQQLVQGNNGASSIGRISPMLQRAFPLVLRQRS